MAVDHRAVWFWRGLCARRSKSHGSCSVPSKILWRSHWMDRGGKWKGNKGMPGRNRTQTRTCEALARCSGPTPIGPLTGWSHYRQFHLLDKLSQRLMLVPRLCYQLPLEEPEPVCRYDWLEEQSGLKTFSSTNRFRLWWRFLGFIQSAKCHLCTVCLSTIVFVGAHLPFNTLVPFGLFRTYSRWTFTFRTATLGVRSHVSSGRACCDCCTLFS